jgi:hypothetical protein
VYSAFCERRGYGGHGARAIVKALVEHCGYTTEPLAEAGDRVAILARGQPVAKTVKAFNAADNAYGEKLRVLVVTQGFNEGQDLKGVRHVHVFDPLTSADDLKQLVGRGVRMCSHADLKYPEEWTVTVHSYESVAPDVRRVVRESDEAKAAASAYVRDVDEELDALKGVRGMPSATARRNHLKKLASAAKRDLKAEDDLAATLADVQSAPNVDSQVFQLARTRDSKVAKLLQVLRDAAIDCDIFKDFHDSAGVAVECASKQKSGLQHST